MRPSPRRLAWIALPSLILLFVVISDRTGKTAAAARAPGAGSAAATVLVGLDANLIAASDADLERRLGGRVEARLDDIEAVRLALAGGESAAAALHRLDLVPGVTYAEADAALHTTGAPTDPLYSGQSAYLGEVGAPSAWDVSEGEASVLVAVLDSGVDLTHEDLLGKIWTNDREIDGNGIDDDDNGCVDDIHGCSLMTPEKADPSCTGTVAGSVADDNGHGTFVSGIIGARGHNNAGGIGAAPGVTILPVKILDCLGGGTAGDAAAGLLYAAKAGARVANLSFGADGQSRTLANAIHEVTSKYGMLVVAATGNEGKTSVTFPAGLPDVLAVGSSGTPVDASARSTFSSWGPEVGVVAPGQNIISTVPQRFCGVTWFCVKQDQPYALASGTSFAAPLVSALAALIDSKTPDLSPAEVRDIIRKTAQSLPDGDSPGWAGAGRVRMGAAMEQKRYILGAPGLGRE